MIGFDYNSKLHHFSIIMLTHKIVSITILIFPQEIILDTLHFCMKINTAEALKSNAMQTFTVLLSHENTNIRSKAARDIMDLRYIDLLFKSNCIIYTSIIYSFSNESFWIPMLNIIDGNSRC